MNYHDYSPDWKDVIRPAILKRDAYKCRVCGILHKSLVYKSHHGSYVIIDNKLVDLVGIDNSKVFKVYLQVAHLDNNKSNNNPKNLLSLCPRHHALRDADWKKFTKKSFAKMVTPISKMDNIDFLVNKKLKITAIQKAVKMCTLVSINKLDASNILDSINKYI